MTAVQSLLIELGCEELPARVLQFLSQQFHQALNKELTELGLSAESHELFATPRRLAVLIKSLPVQQPDRHISQRGPALKAAFDNQHNPTPAAIGFAKRFGVEVSALKTLENEQGAWLFYESQTPGQETAKLLPAVIEKALNQFSIAKPMHWGTDNTRTFLRPVRWLMALWGRQVLALKAFGINSGAETHGHRFMGTSMTLRDANEYVEKMREGFVIPAFAARRQEIMNQLLQLEKEHQFHIHKIDALLDEVTGLVEWPVALLGKFDEHFLKVPREVIITTLQHHQRCFAVADAKDTEKLLAKFITISNIQSKDESAVIAGNERVVKARLSDALFFFELDQKTEFSVWEEKLQKMTFQAGLGTLADKARRISELAKFIAECFSIPEIAKAAKEAGILAKLDLASGMVGEFPELQGVMGYYYAQHKNEEPEVAIAIKEHYYPRFAGDVLPQSEVGKYIAIADKIDTLVGIISLKGAPTADKDPFGLRRAALGVLRILIEGQYDTNVELPFDLIRAIQFSAKAYQSEHYKININENAIQLVLEFIRDRFWHYAREQGFSAEIVQSVAQYHLSTNEKFGFIPYDLFLRMQALKAFLEAPQSGEVIILNKRVSSILDKNKDEAKQATFDLNQCANDKEKNIAAELQNIVHKFVEKELHKISGPLLQSFREILLKLLEFQNPLAQYFDAVMIEDPNPIFKHNRLALLAEVQKALQTVAHLEHLQGLVR